MNADPYSEIINMMRDEGAKFNPPSICLGEVITPYPDISIKIGDLPIYKEDIKVADYLVGGYKRQTKNGFIEFNDSLVIGDEVVLIPMEDGNTYVVLARVV